MSLSSDRQGVDIPKKAMIWSRVDIRVINKIRKIIDEKGISLSEYIRGLILSDLDKQHKILETSGFPSQDRQNKLVSLSIYEEISGITKSVEKNDEYIAIVIYREDSYKLILPADLTKTNCINFDSLNNKHVSILRLDKGYYITVNEESKVRLSSRSCGCAHVNRVDDKYSFQRRTDVRTVTDQVSCDE